MSDIRHILEERPNGKPVIVPGKCGSALFELKTELTLYTRWVRDTSLKYPKNVDKLYVGNLMAHNKLPMQKSQRTVLQITEHSFELIFDYLKHWRQQEVLVLTDIAIEQ